jgi:hypothetical protein
MTHFLDRLLAKSPAHRFGQIIGELVERVLRPELQAVADRHGLYLDYVHPRATRASNPKVRWRDRQGNAHDLDYVFEAGGSDTVLGHPRAFIETAWRRYTKHSRNKAQEIQGAILPLAETYAQYRPYLGVVLGGLFTEGSLTQLRSHGFHLLYYPYQSVLAAFASVGIDASYDESTADAVFQEKVDAYERLDDDERAIIGETLIGLHRRELDDFIDALEVVLLRTVMRVAIVTIHGEQHVATSLVDALTYVNDYAEVPIAYPFVRYEIVIQYTNGNEIKGQFGDKSGALDFLRLFV